MTARIYKVTFTYKDSKTISMVKANTAAQAVRHVIKGMAQVKAASTVELANHLQAGGTIQDVNYKEEQNEQAAN